MERTVRHAEFRKTKRQTQKELSRATGRLGGGSYCLLQGAPTWRFGTRIKELHWQTDTSRRSLD